MKPEIIRLLAGIALFAAAFGCAAQLYRFSAQKTKLSPPIASILLIGITAVITGLQFIFPEVLAELRRNREALLAGEWWRMVTPLFVQALGWPEACVNGITAVILCPLAERLYGKRLLALYFIPGVLGEIFGYLWNPNFAGSSLGIAGVIGGLFAFAFLHHQEISKSARSFAVLGATAAIALCLVRDTHGPPVLIGVLLAVCWLPGDRAARITLSKPCTRGKAMLKRIFKWSAGTILLALLAWLLIAYWTSTNECDRKAAPASPMKAIVHCEYGGPDVLTLVEVEKPTPTDNQVLVRVRAASVNPLDLTIRGPWLLRPLFGMRKPKDTRLGVDYAGTVEAVGRNPAAAGQFKPGDEVFGGKNGALAEYVCVLADRSVVLKPANMTFEQAASVPVAAITALQGLRDKGKIQPGQKVLINGASGGVGTFAVQIAKSFGTEVTGVCSTKNLAMVRSIGADHVIDYTKEDFTKGTQRYDLIFDLVGNHSFSERRRILNPKGICVMAGVGGAGWHEGMLGRLAGELNAFVASRFVSEKFIAYIANLNKEDLIILRDLMQAGKVTPVIDRTYKLNETADALRYLETGHARGKVVVTVE